MNVTSPFSAHQTHRFMQGLCGLILLCFPPLVSAVQIGEVVSLSKLGAPLRVEIPISATSNEGIDSSCLSLLAPEPLTEEAQSYLLSGKLTLQGEGAHRRILLTTRAPFNEVFAKFKLQIKCAGQGSISKIFTLLPDVEELLMMPETEVSVPTPVQEVPHTRPIQAEASLPLTATLPLSTPTRLTRQVTAARAWVKPKTLPRRASSEHFQLKLSGDPLDASRIGKISPEERHFLQARQKLLDADDQMAGFLALQHQVKQLQEEIDAMKSQMAQLHALPAPVHVATTDAPSSPRHAPIPLTQTSSDKVPLNNMDWLWAGVAVLMTGIFVAVWLRRRAVHEPNEPIELHSPHPAVSVAKKIDPSETHPATIVMHAPITSPSLTANPVTIKSPQLQPTEVKVTQTVSTPVVLDEEDSIIEEAQLYAIHKHPLKAAEILHELLVEHPKKTEGWMLLFSIFSSLNQADEFEKNARTFLLHNKHHASWKTIQALGRTLDPNHPLYQDIDQMNTPTLINANTLSGRRPIGDVLVQLGMLSLEDMKNCLTDFDPKLHGRFGGYLITRKVISHEQLNQALIQQQTSTAETPRQSASTDLEFTPSEMDWRSIDVLLNSDKR
jgi:pilus assembly protein FimV